MISSPESHKYIGYGRSQPVGPAHTYVESASKPSENLPREPISKGHWQAQAMKEPEGKDDCGTPFLKFFV